MKIYELTYIISPEITSEEATAKTKEIATIIQEKNGVINSQPTPTAKPLSYPIKGRASGFVGTMEFQLEPENLQEVNTLLTKDGKIVRHMVIIKEVGKVRKVRRSRLSAEEKPEAPQQEQPKEQVEAPQTKPAKEKVELKDIEHELDQILGDK